MVHDGSGKKKKGKKAFFWFMIFILTTLASLLWGYIMLENAVNKLSGSLEGQYEGAQQRHFGD